MKRIISLILILLITQAVHVSAQKKQETDKITWLTFNKAVEQNKKSKKKKKIFIDVYTDWCGWCKKMESSTFTDSAVIATMNKYFLPVRFNAESGDTVTYNGNKLVNPSPGKSRSAHQFAITILQGQLNYPAFVFMKNDGTMITKTYGYREAADFLNLLRYYGEDIYLNKTWDEYKNSLTPPKN